MPEDVAGLVSFLVSKRASYITGMRIVKCILRHVTDRHSSTQNHENKGKQSVLFGYLNVKTEFVLTQLLCQYPVDGGAVLF